MSRYIYVVWHGGHRKNRVVVLLSSILPNRAPTRYRRRGVAYEGRLPGEPWFWCLGKSWKPTRLVFDIAAYAFIYSTDPGTYKAPDLQQWSRTWRAVVLVPGGEVEADAAHVRHGGRTGRGVHTWGGDVSRQGGRQNRIVSGRGVARLVDFFVDRLALIHNRSGKPVMWKSPYT